VTSFEGEFSTPGSSARIWLVLQVDIVSQDKPNNRTLVNWYLRMEERVNASPYNLNHVMGAAAAVDGSVYSAGGLDYDFRGTNVTIGIASGSKYITHDSNGTKTAGVSASYGTDSILGSAGFTSSLALPTIARFGVDYYTGSAWDGDLVDVYADGTWKLQIVEVWDGASWVRQQ
jgi:hypothetical protein